MPETTIMYLHGMGGGHLERDGRRVWLNAGGLARGVIGDELRGELNAAGHVKLFHRPAAWFWRTRGLTVHEFAYDWRISFDQAAGQLREAIAAVPAAHRVLIAAHSMGGCVACRFSALFPRASQRVERAFFFGVPIAGTFAAVQVLLGQFLLPRLVARAAILRKRKQVLAELGQACAAMPGLADLLPDPARYPSAAILYERENWPPYCAPEQALLSGALALKREMPQSPLLERTTVLAAARWPTPAGVKLVDGLIRLSGETAPGDGVTLFDSAAPREGMRVRTLRFPHALLLFEPAGLREVVAP